MNQQMGSLLPRSEVRPDLTTSARVHDCKEGELSGDVTISLKGDALCLVVQKLLSESLPQAWVKGGVFDRDAIHIGVVPDILNLERRDLVTKPEPRCAQGIRAGAVARLFSAAQTALKTTNRWV